MSEISIQNNSPAKPYFVVVKDEADKALTLFEQVKVDSNFIDLSVLKTPDQLCDLIEQETPVKPGDIYVFSEFSQKYIKADTNTAILEDSTKRCEKFLSFCRRIGVKSVSYVQEENDQESESLKREGHAKAGFKDINAEVGVEQNTSDKKEKKHKLDYSFIAERVGNYDPETVENFYYRENKLEHLSEFSQLYDQWKNMNGGSINIKLEYFAAISQKRFYAFNIASAIKEICQIDVEYQQQKEFESVKSLNRTIHVEFFPIEYLRNHANVEDSQIEIIEEMPKKKGHFYLWVVLALIAIFGAITFFLFKFF